ncbi:MAG: DUF418 domain-containing protein [Beutenbergiaceae bacterium]
MFTAAPGAQPRSYAQSPGTPPGHADSRLIGVDTARGLAVLGMFIAHLGMGAGVSENWSDPSQWFFIADGRSSALFALLAGLGVAFMTKGAYATNHPAWWSQQRIRLLKRAAILLPLGWLLTLLGTPIAVILGSYAMLFVLVLPFIKLRPAALLGCAGATIIVMPTLHVLSTSYLLGGADPMYYSDSYGFTAMIPVLGDLWSGYYPAMSWLSYILVGLAVGRLPLRRIGVQLALTGSGVLVAVAGYLPGLMLQRVTSGLLQSLVTIQPHSDTSFEIVGNIGCGLVILGLCLLVTSWAPVRVLLTPISAVGSMSLTIYCAQILVVAVAGEDIVWAPVSQWPLIWISVGSMLFATVWRLFLRQGPLEALLAVLTRSRPSQPRTEPIG